MTPTALLRELEHRQVSLEVIGDRLRWKAPKGVLTAELRQAMQDHRTELLQLLQYRSQPHSRTDNSLKSDLLVEPHGPAVRALIAAAARNAYPGVPGVVRMTKELIELWRAAEAEAGYALTPSGKPRGTWSENDKAIEN